jgi:hypothetical protein
MLPFMENADTSKMFNMKRTVFDQPNNPQANRSAISRN